MYFIDKNNMFEFFMKSKLQKMLHNLAEINFFLVTLRKRKLTLKHIKMVRNCSSSLFIDIYSHIF